VNLTEDALIQEFDRREIPLNKRVLTDWRAKGYLPPLQVKGLGKGRGKSYFWSDPNVIERALLVDEALQSQCRGENILFILWLFGYDVPAKVVREHLLGGLANFAKIAKGESQERGAIEEHIDDITAKYYYIVAKYPQLQLPADKPPEVMQMVLNIFVNSSYDLTDAPFEDGVAALVEAKSESKFDGTDEPTSESHADQIKNAEAMCRFVHEHFSLDHVIVALTGASPTHLQTVQTDIKALFDFIGRIFADKPEIEEIKKLRTRAAYSLGGLLTVVDITLRHQGLGHLVDQLLSLLTTQSLEDLSMQNTDHELS
jgi:hypothetical protein